MGLRCVCFHRLSHIMVVPCPYTAFTLSLSCFGDNLPMFIATLTMTLTIRASCPCDLSTVSPHATTSTVLTMLPAFIMGQASIMYWSSVVAKTLYIPSLPTISNSCITFQPRGVISRDSSLYVPGSRLLSGTYSHLVTTTLMSLWPDPIGATLVVWSRPYHPACWNRLPRLTYYRRQCLSAAVVHL